MITFELKFLAGFEVENVISHCSSRVVFDQQLLYITRTIDQLVKKRSRAEKRERDVRVSPLR